MINVPQNYPGPNAAGVPDNDIPYYSYGHVAGNYPDNVPGPWSAGGVPYAPATGQPPIPPLPEGAWGRSIFNNIQAGHAAHTYYYRASSSGPAYVDWGDGTVEVLADGVLDHVYATSGPRTILYTGDAGTNVEIESVWVTDGENPGWYGPDAVDFNSDEIVYMYIDSWPSHITLNCPKADEFYIGPYNAQIKASASYVKQIVESIPTVTTFQTYASISGTLDLRGTNVDNVVFSQQDNSSPTVDNFVASEVLTGFFTRASSNSLNFDYAVSAMYVYITNNPNYINVNSVTGLSNNSNLYLCALSNTNSLQSIDLSNSGVHVYAMSGCPDLNSLNFSGCTNLTFDSLSSDVLSNVNCNNTNSGAMDALLAVCAGAETSNGTFTGTGNGAPSGQAATDAATLVSRGWTVTTD